MIEVNESGYFITGSDTDAGKTYVACEIIRQLRKLGIDLQVRKPVESGCNEDSQGNLIGADAILLGRANGNREHPTAIAPFRFRAALAPHRAARLEGVQLFSHQLIKACELNQPDSCLIVEGAGGFYSPLAEDALNADIATALQLPVIIVVNDRIGAVNQALMTIAAVESRHLTIAAVIMNQVTEQQHIDMDNLSDLAGYCNYPLFQCLHRQPMEQVFQVMD